MSGPLRSVSHPAGSDRDPEAADERESPASAARATPRIGLALTDLVASTAVAAMLPEEQWSQLLDEIKDLASVLASPVREEADAARLRLISRELAVAKMHQDLLIAEIAERLRHGDYAGARHVDALASSAAKRLNTLLVEHRLTCASARQGIVAIANAGIVKIEGPR